MHTELSGAQDVSKHESVKKTSTLFGMYQKELYLCMEKGA